MNNPRSIIGSTELVEICGVKNIPAKIDTGADSSTIWVSNISMEKDGTLSFVLFGKKSPLYTGEQLSVTDYRTKIVRSSNGHEQIRYCTLLDLTLGGKTLKTVFTLSDRSKNHFPVLIGRYTLKDGDFLVDVKKESIPRNNRSKTPRLNKELQEDPHAFHKKYFNNGGQK